ncbi:hypothetical protein BMS3Bbin04_00838 [bacterium BMS3Bbin04]|nr:hypothetical protein BMS3Bbin04_00838 [bacterium BMS3Bbin04]
MYDRGGVIIFDAADQITIDLDNNSPFASLIRGEGDGMG